MPFTALVTTATDTEPITVVSLHYPNSIAFYEQYPKPNYRILCPECNGEMFVRKRPDSVTHFVHYRSNSACSLSQGESYRHLATKILLYEQLTAEVNSRNLAAKIRLEHPFYDSNGTLIRRADVAVLFRFGLAFAYEVQFSPIPLEQIVERSNSYRSIGVQVVWCFPDDYNKEIIDYVHENIYPPYFIETEECITNTTPLSLIHL